MMAAVACAACAACALPGPCPPCPAGLACPDPAAGTHPFFFRPAPSPSNPPVPPEALLQPFLRGQGAV